MVESIEALISEAESKVDADVCNTRYEQVRDGCRRYHEKHPEVWEKFVYFTFDRIHRGFKHYGAMAIFQRLRWETDAASEVGLSEFKINNNYPPFYARRFMKMYPEHDGFFRTRTQITKYKDASTKPELTPEYFDAR